MNTNIRITDNSAGAQKFIEYARNLPFTVIEEPTTPKRRTMAEAVAECGGHTVDEFISELRCQVKEHFKNLENAESVVI